MGPLKCCVGGCNATSETNRLFCLPANDSWRNLWISMLVPTNPLLIGLSKAQLLKKRVCDRHFDREMFFDDGHRIRYSYPCLFSSKEITHGIPLSITDWSVLSEHNYYLERDEDEVEETESALVIAKAGDNNLIEHDYCLQSEKQNTLVINKGGESVMTIDQLEAKKNSETDGAKYIETVDQGALTNNPTHHVNTGLQTSQLTRSHTTKMSSKNQRYMKRCKQIAVESRDKTTSQILECAKENMFLTQDFEKLNKRAQSFLLMQLRLARKGKMAKRFSLQDKLFALALMKQSPKGYRLLENIFALPNKRTLTRLSAKIVFDCGINNQIFNYLKTLTKAWETKKRICSLVFDEVALTPHLTFDENKDKINGFVEVTEPKRKFADHALVLMVRGICSSWRQSIAYFFCENTVSATEMENILKEVIPRLTDAGLIPLALVCDQGSTFRSCYKHIKQSTKRVRCREDREHDVTVHIAGHDLFIFHDPPHLLKGLRNNFLDKDLLFEGKIATWKDILFVYDLDNKSGNTRALPKLTAQHVEPNQIKKMQVKAAAQVFSARTAAMLNYTHAVYQHLNALTGTMENTAAVVAFFDDLFDSVNGSPGAAKGKLRCAVKPDSTHMEFWRQSIAKFKKMVYIDVKSKHAVQAGKSRHVRVPCLEGWITTLESFLGLANELFTKYEVDYFYPRFINQDPLENFFGQIRAINYRNTNPDANMFVHSFKSIVLSNILAPHSKNANCEDDGGDTLIDLNYLFTSAQENKENVAPFYEVAPSTSQSSAQIRETSSTVENVIVEKMSVQISAYTAGYICRKLLRKNKCNTCKKTIITKEISGIHKYIQYREYKSLKNQNLAYPNEKVLRLYREATDQIHNYLNCNSHKCKIKNNLKNILKNSDMS